MVTQIIVSEEGITDESFALIDEETIRKIFTKSGPRLIFQNNFNKEKTIIQDIISYDEV